MKELTIYDQLLRDYKKLEAKLTLAEQDAKRYRFLSERGYLTGLLEESNIDGAIASQNEREKEKV